MMRMTSPSACVAASASFGARTTNSDSCVMNPCKSPGDDAIERARLLDELLDVRRLARAEELGEQHRVVAGELQRQREQIGDQQPILLHAQPSDRRRRPPHLRRLVRRQVRRRPLRRERRVQRLVLLHQPEQRLVGERKQRAPQRPGQGDLIDRARHRAQQIENVVDLLLRIKRVAAGEVVLEPVSRNASS